MEQKQIAYNQIIAQLEHLAANSQYDSAMFFKTGSDSYSAHDVFVGIKVPQLRLLVPQARMLGTDDIIRLLTSKYNEYRLLGLLILVDRYQKADDQGKAVWYELYMSHIDYVSNWNLVDASAHLIIGAHVHAGHASVSIVRSLAVSKQLWHRRIAMVSMWYFIKQKSFDMPFEIAQTLLCDKHDLIHKAVGWMLRELGKRDQDRLREFLSMHGHVMPRTMYRYAIERLPDLREKTSKNASGMGK